MLTFTNLTDYIDICFWINHLTYDSEDHRPGHLVRGWYPFGEAVYGGEPQTFSNQTVMVYIAKDDIQYDNISFVTPDGIHYRQMLNATNEVMRTNDSQPYLPQQAC